MKLLCQALGETKLLTIGNEYEVINESDDRYTILNDKGIQKNYSKKLFSTVEEVPEIPAKPLLTEINVETIIEEQDRDDDEPQLTPFKIKVILSGDNNFNKEFAYARGLYREESIISCGIHQVSGINGLMDIIADFKEDVRDYIDRDYTLSEDLNIDELFKDIKSSILQDIIGDAQNECGLLLFSTNITNNEYLDDEFVQLLTEMSSNVSEFNNPNSGNTCSLWTINVNE